MFSDKKQLLLSITTMQQVINLITNGETLAALKRLEKLVSGEDKNTVIALMGQFNHYQNDLINGIRERDDSVITRINRAALSICERYQSIEREQNLPYPTQLGNLPLDSEGYLLGRKAALQELHIALQQKSIITLVNGIGGIGKSTLANFYAHFPLYKDAYQACFWITVSDLTGEVEEAIIEAFMPSLELYQLSKEAQLNKILAFLQGFGGKLLLIIDNANEADKVNTSLDWLRKTKVKVLLTSRINVQHIYSQPLHKLLPEDAFTLFTHYYPAAKNLADTHQLLKNIDYHTLLTEFMAKSLAHNSAISLQDLLVITQQQNFTDELLSYTQFTSYHTHTHTKPDTPIQPARYLLQIFPIQNLNEAEQQILRYFAILPAIWFTSDRLLQLLVEQETKVENKPKGIIATIKNFFSKKEKTTETSFRNNRLETGNTLQMLYEKGWLQKSPDNLYACHVLLQHLIRQQLSINATNCKLLLENLRTATLFDAYTNKITLAPYLSLIDSVLMWIKEDSLLISNVYNNAAAVYEAIGNYTQALAYNIENVKIKEKLLSNEDTNLATAYNNIANTYRYLGDYQEALVYNLKDIAICEKVLGNEHPSLAMSYNNIAITYRYLGDYQEALVYHTKAMIIYEKVLSNEHPNVAMSYNNIAETYRQLGDYQEALGYDIKAMTIWEKVLGNEHPNVAMSYNNIAETYRQLGDYQEALVYNKKAITIREKVLGNEHPDVAGSYNNIAITYYYLLDYTNAYCYIQKALAIWIRVLPKNHPYIQSSLDTKAVIEEAMANAKEG